MRLYKDAYDGAGECALILFATWHAPRIICTRKIYWYFNHCVAMDASHRAAIGHDIQTMTYLLEFFPTIHCEDSHPPQHPM